MKLVASIALLVLAGCSTQPGREVAAAATAMGGAQATGAGGSSMVAPPAAAEPSEQHAIEEVVYSADPEPPVVPALDIHADWAETRAQPAGQPAVVRVDPTAQPRPLYRRVETHTKLGAQQEVTPMLKQAGSLFARLNKAHWLGIMAVLVGFGGVLHSAGNRDSGYPLCWLKVMGGGVLAITMGDALWFWMLCGLAAILYAGQKLGIIRAIGVPLP